MESADADATVPNNIVAQARAPTLQRVKLLDITRFLPSGALPGAYATVTLFIELIPLS
jgi:hypothetical protein